MSINTLTRCRCLFKYNLVLFTSPPGPLSKNNPPSPGKCFVSKVVIPVKTGIQINIIRHDFRIPTCAGMIKRLENSTYNTSPLAREGGRGTGCLSSGVEVSTANRGKQNLLCGKLSHLTLLKKESPLSPEGEGGRWDDVIDIFFSGFYFRTVPSGNTVRPNLALMITAAAP